MVVCEINGESKSVEADGATPLLWILRDELGLKGTKFGCGAGLCGACTVHVDGVAVRSCITPFIFVSGKKVTTIEGIDNSGEHPLQRHWINSRVPQCGYCQSGMIMAAAALLGSVKSPSEAQVREEITNLCRCGTYNRIVEAVQAAAKDMSVE